MEQYYTADSYKNAKRISEPFEKSGKLYITIRETCDSCGGTGIYAIGVRNGELVPHPAYNGQCLKCGGKGFITKDVRLYTEKEYASLQKAKENREAKQIEEKAKQEAEKIAKAEEYKHRWMERNGFDEYGVTYCVFGDDTYAIKEWLKEQGCRYSPLLKWHINKPLDIPAGYGMIGFSFDDLYEWDIQNCNAYFREDAEDLVQKRFKEAEGPSLSKYVGEVGERLRNLTAIYKSVRGFESAYGWTNIYTFQTGENTLVWFTQKNLGIEKGSIVDLTGTVKKHEEFRGVQTTQLNRCIVKKIGE